MTVMNAYIRQNEPVLIWTGRAMLDGVLTVPQSSSALVVITGLAGTFHHERIRAIARKFQEDGLSTLIADLLTSDEQQFDARTGHFRVDTPFLASRVRDIVEWAAAEKPTEGLPVALLAGTATAAACVEAADDLSLFALALIGPKFELIRDRLATLDTPTLLVFDHAPTFEQLADVARSPLVGSVITVPGIATMLDNDLAADVAARESLKWYCEHAPLVLGARC
jgi:hypothetical protein